MFDANKGLCSIHGPSVPITAQMSCGLYVHGEPAGGQMALVAAVTPEESGLVDREVRCENCTFFSGQSCGLYDKLNGVLPDIFDLDVAVQAKGCCNGQSPRNAGDMEESEASIEQERASMLRSLKWTSGIVSGIVRRDSVVVDGEGLLLCFDAIIVSWLLDVITDVWYALDFAVVVGARESRVVSSVHGVSEPQRRDIGSGGNRSTVRFLLLMESVVFVVEKVIPVF
jgi:hypothetical protein